MEFREPVKKSLVNEYLIPRIGIRTLNDNRNLTSNGFLEKRFEFPKIIENFVLVNDLIPMTDILLRNKVHDKASSVSKERETKFSEQAKESRANKYFIPHNGIGTLNDNRNLTFNDFLEKRFNFHEYIEYAATQSRPAKTLKSIYEIGTVLIANSIIFEWR